MVDDGVNWRRMTRRAALRVAAILVPLAFASVADAQSIMRTPNLNVPSRTPTINPTMAPRIDPTIAGRSSVGVNAVDVARQPPAGTIQKMAPQFFRRLRKNGVIIQQPAPIRQNVRHLAIGRNIQPRERVFMRPRQQRRRPAKPQ